MHNTKVNIWTPVLALTLVSAAALAAPWDVDMVDSDAVRGYECWEYAIDESNNKTCVRSMPGLPEGVVAQKHLLTPNHIMTPDYPKGDALWDAVASPIESTDAVVANGQKMFNIYCTPCHGKVDENGSIPELGTVAQPGRIAGVVGLTGAAGVLQNRSDGRVYSTIRKGSAIMPSYSWAMTDTEMWSVVHYVRTLDNTQYKPPVPVGEDAGQDGGTE